MSLLDVPADWVTLRAETEEGLPIVVLLDRAVVTSAPHEGFPLQIAVAVSLGQTRDGLPAETDRANLRQIEQTVVDAAAGQARLCAVMTLEGVREWVLYGRSSDWAEPFVEGGLSVLVGEDPSYDGLRALAGG